MTPPVDATETGALFTAHHDRIRRYIAGMVRDLAEAEDLTQETFLRAHSKADALRDPSAARGWLYRIATHVCLDRLRQIKLPTDVGIDEEAARASAPVSKEAPAQERVERAETSACVQRCLDFLPDNYRSVILLYEAHGLRAAEIADLLGINVSTVKIRLHRARRRLQFVMDIGCTVSGTATGVPCCEPKER